MIQHADHFVLKLKRFSCYRSECGGSFFVLLINFLVFFPAFFFPSVYSFKGFDAFGDLLQPSGMAGGIALGPQAAAVKPSTGPSNKVLTGDLDSSLASLAMNLTINKTTAPKYGFHSFILVCHFFMSFSSLFA